MGLWLEINAECGGERKKKNGGPKVLNFERERNEMSRNRKGGDLGGNTSAAPLSNPVANVLSVIKALKGIFGSKSPSFCVDSLNFVPPRGS